MNRKYCPFSFSCEAIAQIPDLLVAQCPNLSACLTLAKSHLEGTKVNLQLGKDDSDKPHSIQLSASSAASLMLRQRGNPQDMDLLGISLLLETLQGAMTELEVQLAQLEPDRNLYIAPEGTEVHTYAVKRPYGTYWYYKLAAHKAMFRPQTQKRLVRHIHLGKTDDPRHREAQMGIKRRNQLVRTRTKLMTAAKALEEALCFLHNPLS